MWDVRVAFQMAVFLITALCRMLNSLNLPDNKPLPGRNVPVPYFFLGDDAFALQTHIIKPYDGNHTKRSLKRVFNYRICRGRRVVENVFGQLTSKFQIFKRPIQLCPQKPAIVTLACVHLFNYIKKIYSETNMILKIITEKSYQVNGAQ